MDAQRVRVRNFCRQLEKLQQKHCASSYAVEGDADHVARTAMACVRDLVTKDSALSCDESRTYKALCLWESTTKESTGKAFEITSDDISLLRCAWESVVPFRVELADDNNEEEIGEEAAQNANAAA